LPRLAFPATAIESLDGFGSETPVTRPHDDTVGLATAGGDGDGAAPNGCCAPRSDPRARSRERDTDVPVASNAPGTESAAVRRADRLRIRDEAGGPHTPGLVSCRAPGDDGVSIPPGYWPIGR